MSFAGLPLRIRIPAAHRDVERAVVVGDLELGLVSGRLALVGLALLLPGTDVVTTFLELIPMLLLYELSVFVARWFERRS